MKEEKEEKKKKNIGPGPQEILQEIGILRENEVEELLKKVMKILHTTIPYRDACKEKKDFSFKMPLTPRPVDIKYHIKRKNEAYMKEVESFLRRIKKSVKSICKEEKENNLIIPKSTSKVSSSFFINFSSLKEVPIIQKRHLLNASFSQRAKVFREGISSFFCTE
ncbi:hypothetical protein NEFER03_1993 [Nematocida sp. LUAm3]|nr:hypothetical protein NEFER03_1993 [Nematocida sp. LUAm3]KAI5176077.1 hypothetical protein NEFER02_1911 [Nematocida sp. LUAm2]KAI5177121.1 hypothetical protein NEFER01_0396 [Nematocida sp. LUAm1]